MVERVVIGTLHHAEGEGKDHVRTEFKPGDVIETDELGLSEEDVARMDENGIFRARRDNANGDSETRRTSRRRPRRSDSSDEL